MLSAFKDYLTQKALVKKKYPNAGKEWAWFWLFPSQSLSVDPHTNGTTSLLHPVSLQKAFKSSVTNLVLRNRYPYIHYGIVSQPIFWGVDMISGQFRNCLVTQIFKQL